MRKFLSLLLSAVLVVAGLAVATTFGYITTDSMPDWSETVPAELTQIGSPYKFYYGRLSDSEKHAYNEILQNVYLFPETIQIPPITAEQLDSVFSALLYDNPDLFFIGRRCTLISKAFRTYCSMEYIVSKEDYVQQKQALDDVCEKVISTLSSPDDEWQTELEIHDYIVDNCSYSFAEDDLVCSSAYGALVNGSAACEGYSKAAKLLLDRVGTESAVLSGISASFDGTKGAHMWNAVKIYGDFYYLDCTWDDPVSENGENIKVYSYFNLNTEMLSATHSDFSYDFGCTATAANYYVKTGKYFENFTRTDEKYLSELIAKELNAGASKIQIRFGSKQTYENAVADLIDGRRIQKVLSDAKKKSKVDFSTDSLVYYQDQGQLTLTVIPEMN